MTREADRRAAEELLAGLVGIPSLSGSERQAAEWLVERLRELGFERSYVDEAGNAVGEIGATDAPRMALLLGHIDTVAGEVPVRRGPGDGGVDSLYGRGAVDAKGPLCSLACGAARFGAAAARAAGLRVVVAGAVEEEAPGSRGARHLAGRFDGRREPRPAVCVIGEPSRWDRLTIGYKGSLLVEVEAERAMTHGAGPHRGVAASVVEVWLSLERLAATYNRERSKTFDQLQPFLRSIATSSDGLRERAVATLSARLPVGFDTGELAAHMIARVEELCGRAAIREGSLDRPGPDLNVSDLKVSIEGTELRCTLRFHGYETAYRAPRGGLLAAAFLGAIRQIGHESAAAPEPRFLVKTGTSDMNVVGPVFECPILAYGPGDSSLDHTPHEHLALDEYWRATRVVETALRRL
ncbi:MAG TPA: M20/M25/M40 family metallo-hydrolase [Thermoanaerobaculia bacterium]|nr:M20/M25/M40 family metallo-hydrolase [Thermoanaerobaculia bacterium]